MPKLTPTTLVIFAAALSQSMLCVTHVPWLTSVSLTAGFLWRRCGKKVLGPCTWATRQLYVSGKRPMTNYVNTISFTRGFHTTKYDQINLHSVCIWDAFLNQYRLSLHTRVMVQLLIFAISTFMMRFNYLISLNRTFWCSYYTLCIIWHKFHLLQFFNFENSLRADRDSSWSTYFIWHMTMINGYHKPCFQQ